MFAIGAYMYAPLILLIAILMKGRRDFTLTALSYASHKGRGWLIGCDWGSCRMFDIIFTNWYIHAIVSQRDMGVWA